MSEGTSKEWFTKIQGIESLEEAKKNQQNMAKMINDLFKKNPAAAIEKVKKDKRLFNYIITALDSDKVPEKLKMAAVEIFIFQENVNDWPKEKALKVLRSSELAILAEKLPLDKQAQLYGVLFKLSEKGSEVLAPMGHLTGVLSKSSLGSRIIAGSKVGLAEFKKLKAVSDFLKAYPILKEGLLYIGDGLTFLSYAYEEYTNPKSPAYGDESKVIYGGINLFLWNAGPLEGAQYGGPVGALAGTLNTVYFYSKYKIINNLPKLVLGGRETLGWNSNAEKRSWLDKQYESYGNPTARTTDKNYRHGVQSESGSKSFNPDINYNNDSNYKNYWRNKMNEFFVKRYENEINNISYEKAKQVINVKQVFSNRLIVVKYCIFIIVILLEIAMFTSFLSKDLFNPVFALIETSIVLITIIYFFRLNFKSFSKSYLIRYYSCCSIVFSIASFIVCCSIWLLLLTYSGKMTSEFYLQMLVQTVFSIAGCYYILLIIYNYMKYRIKQELSLFVKDIKVPKVGKVIEKTTSYGIIVIIGVMQFYRMNKFWIESNESNAINAIIALGQLIVGILCFLILIILPIRMFYPNFISSMLLKKYSEEFRLDYGFSKKEWYEG